MLLSYEFFLTRDPQRLSAALEALQHAVKAEPDRGSVWTRLARVYFANDAFEVTSIPTPIEHAITYGHTACAWTRRAGSAAAYWRRPCWSRASWPRPATSWSRPSG